MLLKSVPAETKRLLVSFWRHDTAFANTAAGQRYGWAQSWIYSLVKKEYRSWRIVLEQFILKFKLIIKYHKIVTIAHKALYSAIEESLYSSQFALCIMFSLCSSFIRVDAMLILKAIKNEKLALNKMGYIFMETWWWHQGFCGIIKL